MPQEYSRSRAKINRNYNENDRGGYTHYASGGGGPYRYLRIGLIAGIGVLIIVIVVIVINMFSSTPSGDQVQQTDPPPMTQSPEPSDTSGLEASETPADASQSPSVAPSDTPQADDSATPDTEESASNAPTNTPDSSESSGDGDNTDQLTVPDIEGTANVTENLSLRESASTTADVITKINKDETFTILEVSTSKTWLKVKYSDKTGYVLAKYVSIGSGGDDKVCTVTGTTINVRNGAGKTHDIIGVLKKGDTVIVLSESSAEGSTWCKISVGSKTGYIDKQYCRVVDNG